MAFAFNYIGHYVTPWDWINHPEEVTCHGRRSEKRAPNDITLHASCDSNLNLEIGVYVGHHHIYGVDKVIHFITFRLIILNFLIDAFFHVIYIKFSNRKRSSTQWSQRTHGVIPHPCTPVTPPSALVLGTPSTSEYTHLLNILSKSFIWSGKECRFLILTLYMNC